MNHLSVHASEEHPECKLMGKFGYNTRPVKHIYVVALAGAIIKVSTSYRQRWDTASNI